VKREVPIFLALSVSLTDKDVDNVDRIRVAEGHASRSAAIRALLREAMKARGRK
tara:strand:+ start:329 stop:490 length:162 start_codon:yes stop_codon:yes gene_type:complete